MILGVTGGIASGKSTVSGYLKSKNLPIVDADAISHKITGKNAKGAKAIKSAFGEDFFIDGRLDRQKLGQFCFGNQERTELLNSILHPLIIEEMDKELTEFQQQNHPIIILDVPLLFESGLDKKCHKTLAVVCEKETRVARAMARSKISRLEVLARIENQMSDQERVSKADFVIDNNGTIENTVSQIDKVLEELNYG